MKPIFSHQGIGFLIGFLHALHLCRKFHVLTVCQDFCSYGFLHFFSTFISGKIKALIMLRISGMSLVEALNSN